MKIFHTREFSNNLDKLPNQIVDLYKKQEAIFVDGWQDPRLHTKKMKGRVNLFSFRITRHYRVLFVMEKDCATFVSIAHRKDIYR